MCMGVFQEYYDQEMSEYSPSTIAWIPSMQAFLMFLLAPIFGKIFDNRGPRQLLIGGSLLHIFGLMMLSLCTKYYQVFLAQGVCSALGTSALFYAGNNTVGRWFLKRRALALGIVSSGSSTGGLVISIMAARLISAIGFPWTIRTIAFLYTFLLAIALLTVQTRLEHRPTPFVPMNFLRPLKERAVAITALASFLFFLGVFIPYDYLPLYAIHEGMGRRLALNLLPIANGTSILGRILPSWAGDRFGKFNVMVLITGLTAIFTLAIWIPAKSEAGLVTFAALYGFTSGSFVALIPAVVAQLSPTAELMVDDVGAKQKQERIRWALAIINRLRRRQRLPPSPAKPPLPPRKAGLLEDEGEVTTLPELIEFNSKHNPDHLLCLQTLPGFDESKGWLQNFLPVTHGSFHRSVMQCQRWLRANIPSLELPSQQQSPSGVFVKGRPIAVLMESEIGLFTYLVALIGLGVPALLLSARLSPTAIENLLRTTGANSILTSPRLARKAEEAIALVSKDAAAVKPSIYFRADFEQLHGPSSSAAASSPSAEIGNESICKPGYYISEEDRNVLILHSSGTTGLPKPVYTAHRYLLGYAACHTLTEDQVSGRVNMSTLPLYHGFGVLAPALSLSIGLTVCFPPSSIIPSAASTLKIIQLSNATSIMTVPSILEDIASAGEQAVIDNLRRLEFVLWGGGPLKPSVREQLAKLNLKLINHSGATEVGALGTVFIPDGSYDSKYIRFRHDLGLLYTKAETEEGQDQQYTMTAYPFGWEDPFVLQDRLIMSPTFSGDFGILGRNDDLLVLATGEKVLPQILETTLTAHPDVSAALAFGEGQFEVGVIVEPLRPVKDTDELRSRLWPIIQEAGSKMDSHSRMASPESILFVAPGSLPRSDKGSVMRKEAYRLLDEQIERVYQNLENHPTGDASISIDSPTFSQDLRQLVFKILGWKKESDGIADETDLFEAGMDSLQAVRLRRALLPTLLQGRQTQASDIPKDFLYRHPSVSAITRFIQEPEQGTDSNEQKQRDLDRVVRDQVNKATRISQRAGVLLTGSTGSLGSHLVSHFCEQDHVVSVICLVRKLPLAERTRTTAFERQLNALAEKGLHLSPQGLRKLEVIETNTAEPRLGLSTKAYRELVATVTHILHNGWPVDFLRQFQSFQSQFDTLGELIQLARQIHATRSWVRPTLQFVSSISTIGRFGEKHDCIMVPEIAVSDVSCTNGIGYAAAKLACENILEEIAVSHSKEIDARYVRVGQMSGARSSGYWKASEHFPALVKSSQLVGALPRISGTFSWLPVDDAATCMSEILFASPGRGSVYHLENPLRQSWADAMDGLAAELQVKQLISMSEWQDRVAHKPDDGNPAKKLLSFFQHEFEHNASGAVVMDTSRSRQVSPTLASMQPVEASTISSYVQRLPRCSAFYLLTMAFQPELLVFGSQTPWPTDGQLDALREKLLGSPLAEGLLKAIENLEQFSSDLTASYDELKTTKCDEVAQAYQAWLKGAALNPLQTPAPNSLLTSLTLLVQFLQYINFLDSQNDPHAHEHILKSTEKGGIQGFCSGLLSAIAVSSSKSASDLGESAAKSFRLAFAIGAAVDLDAQDNELGAASCIAVRWKTDQARDSLKKLLERVSGAYVSVVTDSSCVSVTLPTDQVDEVIQALSRHRIFARLIEVHGRFHTVDNEDCAQRLKQFCDSHEGVKLPDAQQLGSPLWSNVDASLVQEGSLHEIAIDAMLVEQSKWYRAFQAAVKQPTTEGPISVATAGYVDPIPPSSARARPLNINKFADLAWVGASASQRPGTVFLDRTYQDDAIAIIGMSCKFPGADSVSEFWDLINSGTSVLDEVAASRFHTKGLRRTADGKTPFWGCFVRDPDAFDHEFFRKSPREAASMDPKQRMLLEEAYHAMESTGQWSMKDTQGEDIGCYVGVATDDYYDNVNSHAPNAFTATGTLRAFLSGKVSHFFGWTGPSITLDTACSGSLVAIHMACNAILKGECSRAIAGGVNAISSPNMYQNLAAATFLSKTGICKPFDEKADGYCRGEGVGLVVLKKLSAAVADGDKIMAVVAASVTNQNNNETAITVPHTGSQKDLYTRALLQSHVNSHEVSYVEAHGTGTPVGDPREISSIKEVFGGASRPDILHIGSVKGNIGHLEAASGIASVIKTILMMQHETIPPAASFSALNPKIPALGPDRMAIATDRKAWVPKSGFRVACINNYGASGNNAALLLTQGSGSQRTTSPVDFPSYPILISAANQEALVRNCASLLKKLEKKASSPLDLKHVAHELHRTQSRLLPHRYTFKASSIGDVCDKLRQPAQTEPSSKTKPVVLTFGGQSSTMVGLDRGIFDSVTIFRNRVLECDKAVRELGLDGILSAIFQQEPIQDLVTLHACFFTIQYATAMTWIDAGLAVDAVIGHSFGQLTALAVAGYLSLEDGLRLVTGRAGLMKKLWGPVKGSMVSIEAPTELVEHLVAVVNQTGPGLSLEVACYNGPTSHTLVGNPAAVDAVVEIIATRPEKFSGVKLKKLNVTHGFHSVFTEPLLPEIEALGRSLSFSNSASIHLETSSKGRSWQFLTPERLSEHTRTPVYFGEAVDRLAERLGPCTWIEAGTGSSVTSIVRRALGSVQSNLHAFESVQLHKKDSVVSLADVVFNLWQGGHNVKFWPFHLSQAQEYSWLDLPLYQFKKSRHWMPYVDHLTKMADNTESLNLPGGPLVRFSKHLDDRKEVAEFVVNKHNAQFQLSTKGHAVLDQPLCPAGEYLELAVRAAILMQQDYDASKVTWILDNLAIVAPLGLDPETPLKVTMKRAEPGRPSFDFQLLSEAKPGTTSKAVVHGSGTISLHTLKEDPSKRDFARISRLIDVSRYHAVLNDDTAESIRGALVYKLFEKVVTYADFYKGLKMVTSTQDCVASKVTLPTHTIPALTQTTVNTLAVDNFLQVAGINVNCLKACVNGDVYVCTRVERIQPRAGFDTSEAKSWLVYSSFVRSTDREVNNDIYVFDAQTDELCMVIHGVCFTRVGINTLGRTISRANSAANSATTSATTSARSTPALSRLTSGTSTPASQPEESSLGLELSVKKLVNQVAGVALESLKPETTLESTGIDSLSAHELHEEIQTSFDVDIPSDELLSMTVAALVLSISLHKKGDKKVSRLSTLSRSESSVGSVAMSRTSSFASSVQTPATSVSGGSGTDAPAPDLSRLARFVSEQLGTTATMARATCLGDLGLDSLLSLELAHDIEEQFGVQIEEGWLTAETTFGQLADKVVPSTVETKPAKVAVPKPDTPPRKGKIDSQTVVWKQCEDSTKLHADIYLPKADGCPHSELSVALMIHGGGHTMLSRKDVRAPQTQYLLDNGFLPISVDYRLSPEIPLRDGAMNDVCDALTWIRTSLSKLDLALPEGVKVNTGKIVVVGWSTGGTLSMTIPGTALRKGVSPPDAILAFYCPTDYEAEFWYKPNYPEDSFEASKQSYDLLEGVQEKPITAYNIPKDKSNVGGWMNLEDTRSRIVLHMNWRGQQPAVLVNGLPSKKKLLQQGKANEAAYYAYPRPRLSDVQSISPASQIRLGNYKVPTFLVHGTEDDLIPWQQTQQTYDDLRSHGIPADIRIVQGRKHLFDLYRDSKDNAGWRAVRDGYDFLFEHGRDSQEDTRLREAIKQYGLRLDPDLNQNNCADQDKALLAGASRKGRDWKEIEATDLPGRSKSTFKNRHAVVKRRKQSADHRHSTSSLSQKRTISASTSISQHDLEEEFNDSFSDSADEEKDSNTNNDSSHHQHQHIGEGTTTTATTNNNNIDHVTASWLSTGDTTFPSSDPLNWDPLDPTSHDAHMLGLEDAAIDGFMYAAGDSSLAHFPHDDGSIQSQSKSSLGLTDIFSHFCTSFPPPMPSSVKVNVNLLPRTLKAKVKTVLELDDIPQKALYQIMSIALENKSRIRVETIAQQGHGTISRYKTKIECNFEFYTSSYAM
ncbi:hypothetical protein DV735_g5370, partial [Chaetothyriales sp. CBS 134920]